jgi:signal transduction histidine kinase
VTTPVTAERVRSRRFTDSARTARTRISALYGGLFLVSGVALVAATYVIFERVTAFKSPRVPMVPNTASLEKLLVPRALAQTLPQLYVVKNQIAHDQLQFAAGVGPFARDKVQIARAQHELTQSVSQLARAVHQLSRAGAVEAAQRAADSHDLLVTSAVALGVVTVLAVAVGWFVAGRVLRPIRTMTATARRISSTNLHERLALDGPRDELTELGDTLDDLFARLEASFDAQRRFVANASHELRTPVTVERTLLQVALDNPETTNAQWRATAHEVLAASREQAALLEALLTLAQGESVVSTREPVNVAHLVARALVDVRAECDRRSIHVATVMTPALVEGDPLLLGRLVANLIHNAVRHNVEGGRVEVVVGHEGDQVVLTVTNTGPTIDPGEVERLFQPFQRRDPRRAHHREGSGLGLSIVRAIATAHGAGVGARPLPDGGLAVSVIFAPTTPPSTTPWTSGGDATLA